MRTLLSLIEQRRELVDDKTRVTNRLGNALKQYYPQALDWFEQRDTILFCDFLRRWPTLAAVKRARKPASRHSSTPTTGGVPAHRRRASKPSGRPRRSLHDMGVIAPYRLQVLVLVEQLRVTLQAIDRFDRQIAAVAATLPDYALFSPLPGAGPHLAPRLLAAFGEQRERFRSADELQKYSGIAPVTERSGKKLGSLAVAVPEVCPANLCGMGRTDH
jgi:Transposase IS116/IS110/IS902 family.